MKKQLSIILLFIGIIPALCQQNKSLYNKLIIKAKIYTKYKKYDKALKIFEEARKYKPDNWFFYEALGEYYCHIKEKYDSAFVNFEKAVLYGYEPSYIIYFCTKQSLSQMRYIIGPDYVMPTDTSFISTSPKWQDFIKNMSIAQVKYTHTKLNIEQVVKLSELLGADQAARNIEEHARAEHLCYENKFLISSWMDSLNLIDLVDLINRTGFPKYPAIPRKADFVFICLHASMSDSPEAKIVMDSLKNATLANQFEYMEYMHIIDRELLWKKEKPQKFGWQLNIDTYELDSIGTITNIDKVRADYNIPSLYEQCLLYDIKTPKGYIIPIELSKEYSDIIKH